MNLIERVQLSSDWMFLAIFVALVLLTLGKYLFQIRFVNFMVLPFNDKYVSLQSKKGSFLNGFHIILTVFQLINLALFIYLSQNILLDSVLGDGSLIFFHILAFLILFQSTKFILQKIKAYVFNTQQLISEMMFSKLTYLNHSSLFICLANILLIFILKDSKTVIYGTILMIVIINGIGIVKLLKNHQKMIIPNFLYFILYLCALEIAPLIAIGSYLKV